jgi:hypothetical protein
LNFAGGTIEITFTRIGVANTPVAGAPNPTFQLKRTFINPVMPSQVRIKNFDPSVFDACLGNPASANPAWDGTFPAATIQPEFSVYEFDAPSNKSLNGQKLGFSFVAFNTSGVPNSTGCGFELSIKLSPSIIWRGFKLVGTTPMGKYFRVSGCSTVPECLEIESY